MQYMGDKDFWDKKFKSRGEKLLSPEEALVENVRYLKKGTVLDIACGDGRNSVFLAKNNFEVTGIDFSCEAISRLDRFANENELYINTKQIDLSSNDALGSLGVFDNVVVNHYRLGKEQLLSLKDHLCKDGVVFISGFGHKHKVDSRIKYEDLIQDSDFQCIEQCFELIHYFEKCDERGFFVTYIFKKK